MYFPDEFSTSADPLNPRPPIFRYCYGSPPGSQALAGLQVVQLSQRQAYNLARYTKINEENRAHELRTSRFETLYGAFNDSMAHLALGVVIWYGGGAAVQDEMTLGAVILFTRFIDMLFHPIVALGEQTNILFRAMASGERIFQALDWDEKIHEP